MNDFQTSCLCLKHLYCVQILSDANQGLLRKELLPCILICGQKIVVRGNVTCLIPTSKKG